MLLTKRALQLIELDVGATADEIGENNLLRQWQETFMGPNEADGVYGPNTGAAIWRRHQISRGEIVQRALDACIAPIGHWPSVAYSMRVNSGMGETFYGAGPYRTGDCSDFAAHCMGLTKKYQRKWYGTDGIVSDARGYNQLYEEVEWSDARPGDLVVYPGKYVRGERTQVGHVGVIVEVDGDAIKTVDCASSNKRKFGSAVAMRDRTALWKRKKAIIARPVWITF